MAVKCPTCSLDNPDTQKFCAECGTQLTPAPAGPLEATETLRMPVCDLVTGTSFAGRYQVIEELGKGGMGRVYKVLDTKIHEKVALKLIKFSIASDRKTIERFANELKLARRIRHKNVCGMFDLGEAENTHFITMEYVPGEDLKSVIRMTGMLGIGTVLSIGKQICEGLAAAHSLGIVHRDLKPHNIMIDKSGNARIMDFGLARSLSAKGVTSAGVVMGTLDYMAPEQAEGSEPDPRSDIYSLGVILYEMATGRVPFEGETTISIAMKHKGEAPKDPRKLNPAIPADLSRVILKCLEKAKQNRYQSAVELHDELAKIELGLSTVGRVVAARSPAASREIILKPAPRKLLVSALIILLLVAAGIAVWRILATKEPAPSPQAAPGPPTVAVLKFENKSGDTKLDFWRNALPELFVTDLSQSKYIRVVSGDQMLTTLRKLGLAEAEEYSSEDIGKIAVQTRATHVLRGSFIKAGESIIITAGLQKPGTGESSTPLRLEARGENEIIPKVDELIRQVKEGFNLTAAQIAADKEAVSTTTSSPEALNYYVEGRRHQLKNEQDLTIAYMEKAVEIDPQFAMAFRTLATAHRDLGHIAESRKYMKRALELSARLPDTERLFIEGQKSFWDEDYAKAIEILEGLVKAYPYHLNARTYLGNAYCDAGDIDKAIEHQEFVVRNQNTALAVRTLAGYYQIRGLYQKAEDICRSFLQNVEDFWMVRRMLVYSYACRRQLDLAQAEAEKTYLLNPRAKAYLGEVLIFKDDLDGAEKCLRPEELLLNRGKFDENVNLSRQNLERSKGNIKNEADAFNALAAALEKAGRFEEAYKALGQSLDLSAEYRKSVDESGLPYLPRQQKADLVTKGRIQVEMGSFEEAQKTAEELRSVIEKGINKKDLRFYEHILGLIELKKGNPRKAADFIDRAASRLEFESEWSRGDHASSYNDLARAHYEAGELEKARKTYEKITLLTTGRRMAGDIYARAFYMLGKIAEKKGEKERALDHYRKFLTLWKDADPGLPEVEDAKRRLVSLQN